MFRCHPASIRPPPGRCCGSNTNLFDEIQIVTMDAQGLSLSLVGAEKIQYRQWLILIFEDCLQYSPQHDPLQHSLARSAWSLPLQWPGNTRSYARTLEECSTYNGPSNYEQPFGFAGLIWFYTWIFSSVRIALNIVFRLAFLITYSMFFLIYEVVPNKGLRFKSVLKAALFASLLWEVAKHSFRVVCRKHCHILYLLWLIECLGCFRFVGLLFFCNSCCGRRVPLHSWRRSATPYWKTQRG